MVKVNIPTFPLNNGGELPAMGYGTWLGMDENFRLFSEDCPKMEEALSYAIDIGYRHIDTAHFYRVEPEVGRVINRKIREGVVKREDLFITTKVWADWKAKTKKKALLMLREASGTGGGPSSRQTLTDPEQRVLAIMGLTAVVGQDGIEERGFDVWQHFHREADVEESVRGSLKRLGLEYVDLVLIHWPMSISADGVDEKIDYLETWRGFESCVAKGLTRGIGVSNFNLEQMNRLLRNCKIPPACLQIEVNLNFGQEELVALCKAHKIVVVAYSPFGTMVPSHAQPNSPEPKLSNPTMVAIAKKYGKTVSQIALKHLVQRGIAVIPKTNTVSRVLENASIFDFTLAPEDVAAIKAFDCGYRYVNPVFWHNYINFPFEKAGAGDSVIPLAMRKWTDGIIN